MKEYSFDEGLLMLLQGHKMTMTDWEDGHYWHIDGDYSGYKLDDWEKQYPDSLDEKPMTLREAIMQLYRGYPMRRTHWQKGHYWHFTVEREKAYNSSTELLPNWKELKENGEE